MSEKKKVTTDLAWEKAKSTVFSEERLNDFSLTSDYIEISKGLEFNTKNAAIRPMEPSADGKPRGFAVMEAYSPKGEFLGYVTFKKLLGMQYKGVATSKRTGNPYAKYVPINEKLAGNGKVSYGQESLKKVLENKTFLCKDAFTQEVPVFGANLDVPESELKMVSDTYFAFEEVKKNNKKK